MMNRKRLQRQSSYQDNGDFVIDKVENEYDDQEDESVNGNGGGGDDEYIDNERNDQKSSCRKRSREFVALKPATSELTVSFAGQVYVFKDVSSEKVQAVLLLLGGREMTKTGPTADLPFPINRGVDEAPQHSNHSRRIASLARFREKRKERCFDKKVHCQSRKEVAQRMQHWNGQLDSLRETRMEGFAGSSSRASPRSSYQDINTFAAEIADSKCQHCGIVEKSTPVMRSGPAGPRSLCDACGLMWRKKGTLRDLIKDRNHLSSERYDPEVSGETKSKTMEPDNLACNDKQETSSETNTSNMGGANLAAKDVQVGTEGTRPSSSEIESCSAGSYEQSAQESGLGAQSLWGDLRALSSSNFWDLQGIHYDLAQVSTDIGIPSNLIDQIVGNDSYLGSGM
ncbi:Gata transcription factor [Thalictrum thalictroides]|uniref:Gata transcription factor n=1 Tax=Thalictrum thalictroides TaxID=46969 RepID=A0A7J6V958_THATH|nr:Gata transcription factor [Thalictrum thalictroides]